MTGLEPEDAPGAVRVRVAGHLGHITLDALIGDYAKPVVVLMDGVTMGGGIGLGGHASHRLVTERSVLAMPEVKLGIVPDCGGTLLFARAPGLLGRHLAMTGDRFGPGDAIHLGVADACVDSSRLPRLTALLATKAAEDAVPAVRGPAPSSPLLAARDWIDHCYAANDAAAILTRLRRGVPDAAAAADRIESASPLAVCVALRAVERAGEVGELPGVLDQDLRIGLRLLEGSDPVEGIRAAILDRTHRPSWRPASVAEVREADVERCLAGLGAAELGARARMRQIGSFETR